MKKDEPTFETGWKNRYRELPPCGWEWGGWLADEGLHFFQKGNYIKGFSVVKCRDSECFDGSLELMCERGLTR